MVICPEAIKAQNSMAAEKFRRFAISRDPPHKGRIPPITAVRFSASTSVMVTGSNTGDVDVMVGLPTEIFQRVKDILNKARLGGETRAQQENEAVRALMENDPELDEPTAMEFVRRLTETPSTEGAD